MNLRLGLTLWLLALCASFGSSPAHGVEKTAPELLGALAAALPQGPDDCLPERTQQLAAAADLLEGWAADATWTGFDAPAERQIALCGQLMETKAAVDRALAELLAWRGRFAAGGAETAEREAVRQYLRMATKLIDLSGRLRYTLRDAVDNAAYVCAASEPRRLALIDLAISHRESIAALQLAILLEDPDPATKAHPASLAVKQRVVRLIAACGDQDLLPDLARVVRNPRTPVELLFPVLDAIRQLGIPQVVRPGQPRDAPLPAVTAEELHRSLAAADVGRRLSPWAAWRRQMLAWLDDRAKFGVRQDTYRVGGFEVQPGDWVLLKNPSPYNLFTDLAPGLFTHVGVVTTEQGADGRRRFVVVDLPERGDRMPATNVESFLTQSLHYCVVRHSDPAVRAAMADAARATIGNETEFDLTFRTARLDALRGKPLAGQRISTYCAGFLLLCARATGRPDREFFPFVERVNGGQTAANLQVIGLAIGDNFVSPTGPLFSPRLELVGRRHPMYDPGREIRDAIYDDFAILMRDRSLQPSPNGWQAFRERLAAVSKSNPWLKRALAQANNVSETIDLEAAAKAATMIETLDDVADGAAARFRAAFDALDAGPEEELAAEGYSPPEIARIKALRTEHAALFARYVREEITPRELRLALIQHFIAAGQKQLREKYFPQ